MKIDDLSWREVSTTLETSTFSLSFQVVKKIFRLNSSPWSSTKGQQVLSDEKQKSKHENKGKKDQ